MSFYHLTSFESAQSIQKYGFEKGNSGMPGAGIYFAFNFKDTFIKATSSVQNALIIVHLNTGNIIIVSNQHNNWNLKTVNAQGYDSVHKLNCKTGSKICV